MNTKREGPQKHSSESGCGENAPQVHHEFTMGKTIALYNMKGRTMR